MTLNIYFFLVLIQKYAVKFEKNPLEHLEQFSLIT